MGAGAPAFAGMDVEAVVVWDFERELVVIYCVRGEF